MFNFYVGLVLLISIHHGNSFFWDSFGHSSGQNSGLSHINYGNSHNSDQSKDISHNGGDTDQSRKCDHPDKRDHVKTLLYEWHKHRDDSSIMKVYEWTVLHEKTIHAQVLGKRGDFSSSPYFEAYSHFRPDLRHIEVLIRNDINSACRQELIREIEKFFSISTTTSHHQHHTSHKTSAATARKTHHTHPKTTTQKPTPAPTTKPKTTTTLPTTTSTTTTTLPTTVRRLTTKQHTTKPTPQQTTEMMTDSTTTMVDTTTTQSKPSITVDKVCNALSIVTALAKGAALQSPRAGLCTDGSHSQSEALILDSCDAVAPRQWKQGPNVMANCESIPTYTPIGTFTFGQYVMDGNSLSGVFVGCSKEGFKMAVQLCGQGPQVFELKTSSPVARENAANYYIIDW